MTTQTAGSTRDFLVPAPSAAARVGFRPRLATGAPVLVLVGWALSLLMALDGLVRAGTHLGLGVAEILAAAVPSTAGIVVARVARRTSPASIWVSLGTLPSLVGLYFLLHMA